MIVKGEIKDPRVESVVITDVRVTRDMGIAKLYFTVIGDDEKKKEALKGLESASGFIQRELWRRFRMKKVPDVKFEIDTVLEKGYEIDEILKGLESE